MKYHSVIFVFLLSLALLFVTVNVSNVFAAHTITVVFNDTGNDGLIRGSDTEVFLFNVTNNGPAVVVSVNFTVPQHSALVVNSNPAGFSCAVNLPYINCTNTTTTALPSASLFEINISATASTVDQAVTLTVDTSDTATATQSDISWSMTIDSTAPSLNITAPSAGNYSSPMLINASMSDARADNSSAQYAFGNSTGNFTETGTIGFSSLSQFSTTTFFNKTVTLTLQEGLYTLYVRANDTVDNQNVTVVAVTVDNTLPSVTINSPSGTLAGLVLVNATVTDTNLDASTVEYTVSDGVTNYTGTHTSGFSSLVQDGSTDFFNASFQSGLFTDTSYTIYIRANDTAGNQKVVSATFSILNSPQNPNPQSTPIALGRDKLIIITLKDNKPITLLIEDGDLANINLKVIRPSGVSELNLHADISLKPPVKYLITI